MEEPDLLSFSEGFYYLYLKKKYIHKCNCQHNINVTENRIIKDNSFHPNIQFTCEVKEENKLPFLDVLLIRNGNFTEILFYQIFIENQQITTFI